MGKIKEKISNFYQNHKKGFTTGCIIVGTLPLAALLGVSTYGIVKDKKQKKLSESCNEDDTDYGRDCLMQFVTDDEDHEVLGAVPCTELFAKESIEDYDNFLKTK